MKLILNYYYQPNINNSRVCVVSDGDGKEIAKGYHHELFTQAKWSALHEAQRILAIPPIIVPKTEYVDVNWYRGRSIKES